MPKHLTLAALAAVAMLCAPEAGATSYVYDAGADLDVDGGQYPDGGQIPCAPKSNWAEMPAIPAWQKVVAYEVNKYRGAISDERDATVHGYFHGLADQGVTPVPAPADGVREFAMDGGLYGEYPDAGVFRIGGAAGWVSAFDCDFTAQSPQSVSSNGTMTVCGVTADVQVTNGGHTYASAIAVLPDAGGLSIIDNCAYSGSSGLPLVSDAGATNTTPRFVFGLDALIPNLSSSTAIRVTTWNAPWSGTITNDGFMVAVDNGGNNSGNFALYGYGEGYTNSAGSKYMQWSNQEASSTATNVAGQLDVMEQMTINRGMMNQDALFSSGSTTTFPPVEDSFSARAIMSVSSSITALNWTYTAASPANFLAGLACPCGNSGVTPCTVRRLKIEYRP